MKTPAKIIILIVILLAAGGAVVYYFHPPKHNPHLCYSGTIESTSSNLAFQVSGRIINVYVDEGHRVSKDMVLAEIDDALYQTKLQEAQAGLDQSQRNFERLQILLAVYEQTLPADVKRAKAGVSSARAVVEEAKSDKKRFDDLKKNSVVSQRDWESVNLKYETAISRLTEARAILDQAESSLKKIELTQKEIQVAQTQFQAAQSAVAYARIQMAYTRLISPFSGIVTTRNMEPGEVVTPGKEVLILSDLSQVELKIFVGEEDMGKVRYGDTADITIDTFPDRTYNGKVTFISPEAEFTPKIIQTQKERVKLVYMVKITLPNPDVSLKPGMPADACFAVMSDE